ncbi:PHP domain-containing protein [Chloroflexota bacterium]
MSKVDLHVHSSVSDGKYTPPEIVGKAAALGLSYISLTDHDSVDGITPARLAAADFPGLTVIPGVEISTEAPDREVHVLGYFIDYNDKALQTRLAGFTDSREERARKMIAKLGKLGINIEWSRVREIAGEGSIGRPHIAQAMLEKGYITSFAEAFDKYIGHGGPAYAERDKMTPAEAVELIIQADGLPVLAHPLTIDNPEALVIELKEAGLTGLEAHYKDYTAEERLLLADLANKYNLITTGGSDYHGINDNDEIMMGEANVPLASAERLIALAGQRGLKTATLNGRELNG